MYSIWREWYTEKYRVLWQMLKNTLSTLILQKIMRWRLAESPPTLEPGPLRTVIRLGIARGRCYAQNACAPRRSGTRGVEFLKADECCYVEDGRPDHQNGRRQPTQRARAGTFLQSAEERKPSRPLRFATLTLLGHRPSIEVPGLSCTVALRRQCARRALPR